MLAIIAIVFIAYRRSKRKTADKEEAKSIELRKQWEKEAEEERKRLNLSKILVTEEQFNDLSEVSTKAQKILNRLCYDEGFIRYVHEKDDRTSELYNGKDLYLHYKYEPLYDILWVFNRLGCLCDYNGYPPAYHGWEKDHDSHQDLLFSFDDDSVEYTVELYS